MNDRASEFQVVAFHGVVVPGRSPGLHGVVVVDREGHLLRDDGRVDAHVHITSEGPLPGEGTRIGPWPYAPGKAVITADRALLRKARAKAYSDFDAVPAVRDFLDEVEHNDLAALARYHAQRVDDSKSVVAWYATPTEIDFLRALLRAVAHDDLRAALAVGGDHFIREEAWQLQRAATAPDDEIFALAALQVAGIAAAEVRELLDELVRDVAPRERRRRFTAALKHIRDLKKRPARGAASEDRESVRERYLTSRVA